MPSNREERVEKLKEFFEAQSPKTLHGALGIEVISMTPDRVEGRMPIDERTHQPMGLLHGGANVALAEGLASIGANLSLDPESSYAVGLEINANHIRGERSGWAIGVAEPIHRGATTQIWSIEIRNEAGKLMCTSRCTLAVLKKK